MKLFKKSHHALVNELQSSAPHPKCHFVIPFVSLPQSLIPHSFLCPPGTRFLTNKSAVLSDHEGAMWVSPQARLGFQRLPLFVASTVFRDKHRQPRVLAHRVLGTRRAHGGLLWKTSRRSAMILEDLPRRLGCVWQGDGAPAKYKLSRGVAFVRRSQDVWKSQVLLCVQAGGGLGRAALLPGPQSSHQHSAGGLELCGVPFTSEGPRRPCALFPVACLSPSRCAHRCARAATSPPPGEVE